MNPLRGAYDGVTRSSCQPWVREWSVVHVRSPHWDADGDEGDVVVGGVTVFDAVDAVAVRLVFEDHGVEENG